MIRRPFPPQRGPAALQAPPGAGTQQAVNITGAWRPAAGLRSGAAGAAIHDCPRARAAQSFVYGSRFLALMAVDQEHVSPRAAEFATLPRRETEYEVSSGIPGWRVRALNVPPFGSGVASQPASHFRCSKIRSPATQHSCTGSPGCPEPPQ